VEIVSPANGAKLDEASVSVKVRVTDKGGGIGLFYFKVDGQRIGSAYGPGSLKPDGTFTTGFDLARPDAKIEVVAEDRSGDVLSLPAGIAVHADPKTILGVPDLYVLAIGADRYLDTNKALHFAVKDASDLAGTLGEAGKGFYRNPPIVKTLADKDVTAEAIGAAFKELGAKVKATDVFVFYIAGHGATVDADYYFLPPSMRDFSEKAVKAGGFGPKTLPNWFAAIKAEKSIWIFDTCQSGSAGRLFMRDATADAAAYARLRQATGRAIFMAASGLQAALEGYRNHGLFTYALLEAIGKADKDKVQLHYLADYVRDRVPELSRDQKSCEIRDMKEYCQQPIVDIGATPDYPIVPSYPKALAMLGADAIPLKPTHVVIAAAELFETPERGVRSGGQIQDGEEVTVVKVEGGLAQIAQDGKLLGFVDKSKLVKLRK
jgi:hypothetical protein